MDGHPPSLSYTINPRRLLTEAEFAASPRPAVAIKAVDGPPAWSANRWNVDHHSGVPRPFYDSACKQVLVATEYDLWRHLTAGIRSDRAWVYLARVDEDAALAVALLEHPDLAASPSVRRLVQLEDALDRSGGTGCANATEHELGQIAWINEPYHRRRSRGGLTRPEDAHGVLREIVGRVETFASGQGSSLSPVGDIDVIASDGRVAVVIEHGPYARLRLRGAGIDAYVAQRDEDGSRIVTVGLTSPFVTLDLAAVYTELNTRENRPAGGDRWGGGSHIGGSPLTGTGLDTDGRPRGSDCHRFRASTAVVTPTNRSPPASRGRTIRRPSWRSWFPPRLDRSRLAPRALRPISGGLRAYQA